MPILNGFRWLGLDWDEGPSIDGTDSVGPHGPYFQSQRAHLYQAAAERLLATGKAYRDYATTEELQAQRERAREEGKSFVYDRSWMAETDEQAAKFEAEGRTAVVRLKMPRDGVCQFTDLVRGDVEFDWAAEQDHVVQRADGSCLYHLASVVDDHEMQITHVVRAEEHLSNTPRQIFIAQSLGFAAPTFAHLPYVAEPGGTAKLSKRKLSKYLKNQDFAALCALGNQIVDRMATSDAAAARDAETFNPVIVDFYEAIGFTPAAILNYLLLLGWSLDDSTEEFSREQMLEHFSLERINKAPASFDPKKLLAFQARTFGSLDLADRLAACHPFLESAGLLPADEKAAAERVSAVVEAAGDRLRMGGDILDFSTFFVDADQVEYEAKAWEKRMVNDASAVGLLAKFKEKLAALEPFDVQSTEACLKEFVESEGIKFNQIIHALRVSVTGSAVGFGMFDALAILGKEQSLARIDRALATVTAAS